MGVSSTLVRLDRERGEENNGGEGNEEDGNEEEGNEDEGGESESDTAEQDEEDDQGEPQSGPADQDEEDDEEEPQSDSMSLEDEDDPASTSMIPPSATTSPTAPRLIRSSILPIPSYLTVVRYAPPDSPSSPLRKRHQASLEISALPMEKPKFLLKGSATSNPDYTHSHPSIQYRDVEVDAFFYAQWTMYDAAMREGMGGDGDEDGWRTWPRSKNETRYACA